MGRYRWANNMVHGFSHVHVEEREFTVRFIGITDQEKMTTAEIYRVTVINDESKSFLKTVTQ